MTSSGEIDPLHAIVIAVLQGITELFPVSSLGHAVIVPHLLRWDLDESAASFLPFLVALHVGTALALLIYFWRDWWALLGSLAPGGDGPAIQEHRRLLLLLVLGTIPAGLLGLLLEKRLAAVFGQFQVVAVFLIVNGCVLIAGEWLRRRAPTRELATLT